MQADELPELMTIGNTGRTVRHEDVDTLSDEERRDLWAKVGTGNEARFVRPFGQLHDGAAFAAPSGRFLPAMGRLEASGLGWDDAELQRQHTELFGQSAERLDPDSVDTREQMELRKRMYDRVIERLHGGG